MSLSMMNFGCLRTRQAMYVWRNTEVLYCNHFCPGKAISITNSECVYIALSTQQAKRMRRIILSSVACPAVPHFCTLSHNWQDLKKKKLWNIKYVWILYTDFSERFLILRRTERDIIINVHMYSCKVPGILVRFNENFIFSTDCLKIPKYKI